MAGDACEAAAAVAGRKGKHRVRMSDPEEELDAPRHELSNRVSAIEEVVVGTGAARPGGSRVVRALNRLRC